MALYALLLVGMGFFLRGRASGSVEDYFIGGRKMPWWLLGTSGMAQFVDITGTALIISFLFMMGPKALLVELRGGLCIHREHFYDIISLPFVLIWHYLLLLLPVLLVIGNFKEFTGGAVLFIIALTGMYFFWYKKLPKENFYDDK